MDTMACRMVSRYFHSGSGALRNLPGKKRAVRSGAESVAACVESHCPVDGHLFRGKTERDRAVMRRGIEHSIMTGTRVQDDVSQLRTLELRA